MDALGKFGEQSRAWGFSQLLRIYRALQTPLVHLFLDVHVRTLSMNQFLTFVLIKGTNDQDITSLCMMLLNSCLRQN